MLNIFRRSGVVLGGFVACLALASTAEATPIAPGDVLSPVPSTGGFSSSGPFLANTGLQPWNASPSLHGLYISVVYDRDPGPGVLLDFLYQVGNDSSSTDSLTRLVMSDFTGWITDAFYYIEEGTKAPSSVDRNALGSTVEFVFGDPILPDTVSKILVIRTNASSFGPGSFDIGTERSSATVSTFAPVPVPEPSSLLLLGTGFVVLRRRFRRG